MSYRTNEERETEIRQMFSGHIFHLSNLSNLSNTVKDLTWIEWHKPGTWVDSLYYVINRSYLLVYGDQGDAVYSWGEDISLEFLSRLHLEYFASKCRASATGIGGKEWDSNLAQDKLASYLESIGYGKDFFREEASSWPISSQGEWMDFLHNSFDPEEYAMEVEIDPSDLGDIGLRPSYRTHVHLVGLKMIQEAINEPSRRLPWPEEKNLSS